MLEALPASRKPSSAVSITGPSPRPSSSGTSSTMCTKRAWVTGAPRVGAAPSLVGAASTVDREDPVRRAMGELGGVEADHRLQHGVLVVVRGAVTSGVERLHQLPEPVLTLRGGDGAPAHPPLRGGVVIAGQTTQRVVPGGAPAVDPPRRRERVDARARPGDRDRGNPPTV